MERKRRVLEFGRSFAGHVRRQPLLSAVSGILLFLIVLMMFAPLIAPIPKAAAGWTAPPLPDRNEPLPGFQDLLDPLPIVVRDLPDEASAQAYSAYETTTGEDLGLIESFLVAAENAIDIPPHIQSEWDLWFSHFLSDDNDVVPFPELVLRHLKKDERNGDRLSNLAVAAFYRSISIGNVSGYNNRSGHVVDLLKMTVIEFPDSRGATLNYVYLRPHYFRLGAPDPNEPDGLNLLNEWVSSHPSDYTAQVHLVRINPVHPGSPQKIDQETMASRMTMLADSSNASVSALGYTMLGDLKLKQAQEIFGSAPFTQSRYIREAITYYDRALLLSDDSSIYAARAWALLLLGDVPAAVRTQEFAVLLDPESVPLLNCLAEMYLEQRWQDGMLEKSAHQARNTYHLALTSAINHRNRPLHDLEMFSWQGQNGLLPFASNRPNRDYIVFPSPGGAGAYVVAFDLIPPFRDVPLTTFSATAEDEVAYNSLLPAILLGDPKAVSEDLSLNSTYIQDPVWPIKGPVEFSIHNEGLAAARLVVNTTSPSIPDLNGGLTLAITVLRWGGLPDQALNLCNAALKHSHEVRFSEEYLHICISENAYLAREYEQSLSSFLHTNNLLMAGMLAEVMGNTDDAVRYYQLFIDDPSTQQYIRVLGQLRLGTLLLDEGSADTAIQPLTAAIGYWEIELKGQANTPWLVKLPQSEELQIAHSNRGVARLKMSADRNGNIDCIGDDQKACRDAFLDFDAALQSDPFNPVFLMNRAWVARLQGDNELSAELMQRALESDPGLYPVHNDLGVLAVMGGDQAGAEQYFLDAIAANPDYSNGLWNLGVWHMQRGLPGVLKGQAYLARAILKDHSLLGAPLQFKTDESIYRVEITEQSQPSNSWSFSRSSSVATAGFGILTFSLLIFQAMKSTFKDKVVDFITPFAETGNRLIHTYIRPIQSKLGMESWPGWVPLLLALLVMLLVVINTAKRGDPGATTAAITIALLSVGFALLVHELGHGLAARYYNAKTEAAPWAAGIPMALFLMIFNISSGPYPGQKVISANQEIASKVLRAGPLANLVVAIFLYALFRIEPLPMLRMMAIAQLGVMSYSLLPFDPLDGALLNRVSPRLVYRLATFAAICGALTATGRF